MQFCEARENKKKSSWFVQNHSSTFMTVSCWFQRDWIVIISREVIEYPVALSVWGWGAGMIVNRNMFPMEENTLHAFVSMKPGVTRELINCVLHYTDVIIYHWNSFPLGIHIPIACMNLNAYRAIYQSVNLRNWTSVYDEAFGYIET